MRLFKIQGKENGYNISLIIGNKEYISYWSSPPKNIDHVGIDYLSNRYSKITTKKRLNKFKALYRKLWT